MSSSDGHRLRAGLAVAALCAVALCAPAWTASPAAATRADIAPTLRLIKGHSEIVHADSPITSIAIGAPRIARASVVSPTYILVNAVSPGSTTMSLIHRNGKISTYRLHVIFDLRPLDAHLRRLDPRIRVMNDPNGDAIILQGEASSRAVVERAVEAAYRFVGEISASISTNPRERRERPPTESEISAEVASQPVVGAGPETSPIVETITSGATRVINLLVTDDLLVSAARRLEDVLRRIAGTIRVEEVNNVFLLRGTVATPATLSRALIVADRFVQSGGKIDIQVVADHGGVLAGDADASQAAEAVIDELSVPRLGIGTGAGARAGAGIGGRQSGLGGTGLSLPVEVSPPKGNLGQNVSRADIVSVAGGRVLSLLTVAEQPRVELKMSIVAINRSKTDELGVRWRIDGSRISVTTTGDGLSTPPNTPNASLSSVVPGGLNAAAKLLAGATTVQTFLRAIEETGAGTTVSEPLLTAVSGEAASFLVGGNIPIPVQVLQSGTPTQNALVTTNVAFIEFGLRIVARPTVLESGRIGIVLDQILTEPDQNSAIVINGASVPGFTQRSVRTVTESLDGETWAVAGLVSDSDISTVTGVPILSKIPLLGALFRSKSTEKIRSELVITVTAHRVPDTPPGEAVTQVQGEK